MELANKMDVNNRNRAYAYIITKMMDPEQSATLTTVDIDGEAITATGKDAATDVSNTVKESTEKAEKQTQAETESKDQSNGDNQSQ